MGLLYDDGDLFDANDDDERMEEELDGDDDDDGYKDDSTDHVDDAVVD